MNELNAIVTETQATDNLKLVISKIMEQNTELNAKLDALQSTVDVCKDSISALNTSIAQSSNWMAMLLGTPYGVIVVGMVMMVIGAVALKKGIKLSKGEMMINLGADEDKK